MLALEVECVRAPPAAFCESQRARARGFVQAHALYVCMYGICNICIYIHIYDIMILIVIVILLLIIVNIMMIVMMIIICYIYIYTHM